MAESHLDFTRPSHVVGRYALYGRLAAGGMATVHLGRLMEADGSARTVAVKRLHPQFCKDPEFVAMFIDEARLAARIKHANVVETLDILTMGQELLLVMEYIRGECFSKLLRAARRKNLEPSIGVVGRIAFGMLHGLHAAHEARDDNGELLNVVHRDVSPQNVMIDASGMVKVLDFGVAKASARIQITRDGQMKGKLSYMSPEQLQGLPVDRRADVFACGVVLWEALTRRRLFVGEDASEVLRKILRDDVPAPSEWAPGLSPEVDQVVLRALSRDPEQRYQTALDLATDIERVIELAPDSEVAAWLESVAGEIMGKRERLLAEIESSGLSELSFSTDGSGSIPPQGSLTESDTFQRIQSWAASEAARVAEAGHPSLPPPLEATPGARIVADARCVEDDGVDRTETTDARAPDFEVSITEADEPESAVTLAEDPSFGGERDGAPASRERVARAAPSQAPPAFGQATVGMVEGSRRMGRWLGVVAAAAVVLGLVGVAVVGVQPGAVVRARGALLPESTASSEPRERASGSSSAPSAAPTSAEVQPALHRPSGAPPEPIAPAVQSQQPVAEAAPPAAVAPQVLSERSLVAEVGSAPSPATVEPAVAERTGSTLVRAKERASQPVSKQRPSRRAAPPPRRRAAAAPPKATGAPKVDCRQPFWIDESGIRRIKMACL